jgi:hypothetical protein
MPNKQWMLGFLSDMEDSARADEMIELAELLRDAGERAAALLSRQRAEARQANDGLVAKISHAGSSTLIH